jgi:hypothetical protein
VVNRGPIFNGALPRQAQTLRSVEDAELAGESEVLAKIPIRAPRREKRTEVEENVSNEGNFPIEYL